MLIRYIILIVSALFSQQTQNNMIIDNDNNMIEINNDFVEDNLFEQLLTESKLFYAEAIISDLRGDSLKTPVSYTHLTLPTIYSV